jgi:hypothetical protein
MAAQDPSLAEIEKAIPEYPQDGRYLKDEDEAWKRAFYYAAILKGNYVPEAEPGRQYRGAVIYADAHADSHVNSIQPVAPVQQVQVVEATAPTARSGA